MSTPFKRCFFLLSISWKYVPSQTFANEFAASIALCNMPFTHARGFVLHFRKEEEGMQLLFYLNEVYTFFIFFFFSPFPYKCSNIF